MGDWKGIGIEEIHHELYVKKYIDYGSTLRLIEGNKYGHNIRDLLAVSKVGSKQQSIIERHCNMAESKSKLNNIKYYPDLRYNFSKTKFRNRAVEDVLIYRDNTENSIIRLMVKETVEGFKDD